MATSGETTPELSAIVLCYRAGEHARDVVEPLRRELLESGVRFELVLVGNYDADDDPTPGVVRVLAADHPEVRSVVMRKGGGMGWDMRSGFDAARGEIMIAIDGDAQNPTEDVLRMFREMRSSGAEVMKGRRVTRLDSAYRRMLTRVYNFLFRLMFGTRGLADINGKPKGLTRGAYQRLEPLESDDWFIDAEIVIRARREELAIRELPVTFRENDQRSSFVRPRAIWEFVVNMLRYRWRRR